MSLKNIKLLSIFNLSIGFNPFWPLAIIYFAKVSGSYTLGTSIFGIIMLASAFLELPTGVLSDRIGRKKTIVLGSWARLLAYLFYAIGLSYWFLVIGAVLEGLSRSFYSGNNDALLYDSLSENKLKHQYQEHQGKVSSTEQFAMGVSAIIGSLIASYSFKYLVWISLLPQIAILIISYMFIEPQITKKISSNIYQHLSSALKLFIHNQKLCLLSLASIISFSISELKWQFGSAFVVTVWPIWAIGISKLLPSFGSSISFFYSGKLIKKFKEINILLFSSIYGKIISFIAYGFPSIFSPLLLATPSVLHGVSSVSKSTLMQHQFTDEQRATMSSLNSLGGSLGFAIMSLFLGGLADSYGPAKALIVLTLVSLPTVYIYWLLFKSSDLKTN
jgi:MFS family permease